MGTKRNIDIEHHVDGSVVRWVITDAKLKANTCGIIVMIDMSLPESYQEAVFAIAADMNSILLQAAEKFRNEMFNIAGNKKLEL